MRCRQVNALPEVIQSASGRVKIVGVRETLGVKWGKHEGGLRTEQMASDMMRSWVSYVRAAVPQRLRKRSHIP